MHGLIICGLFFLLTKASKYFRGSIRAMSMVVKFFDYALLGDDIVIADPVVAKSYLEVMEECKVTISKEKSLISNVSALEFAKILLVYKVTLDFSPVSLRVLRILSSGVSAFLFSELRVNLLCSYRLRSGSYKVYSRQGLPTSKDLGVLTADCMFERLMKDGWSIIPDICIGISLVKPYLK
ncbi:hypothetical protein Patl1_37436 [Pistacia atlantica]|nr:hypothetical protein Patl1_37436 [Pistacia atlantica]